MTRSSQSSRHYRSDSLEDYQNVDSETSYRDRQAYQEDPRWAQRRGQNRRRSGEDASAAGASRSVRDMGRYPSSTEGAASQAPDDSAGKRAGTASSAAVAPYWDAGGVIEHARQRDPMQAWQMVREDLRHSLPTEIFNRFVEKAWVLAYEDGDFVIAVPDAFSSDWLESRLRQNLKRRLGRYLGRQSIDVGFAIQTQQQREDPDLKGLPLFEHAEGDPARENVVADKATASGAKSGATADVPATSSALRPVQDVDQLLREASGFEETHPREAPAQFSQSARAALPFSNGGRGRLLPEFTFDTFVVGSHNRLAHAAATAVAEAPSKSFNPLFVYGGVGLGKTHLLHAIGNAVRRMQRNVLYCSSEQFTNELIQAIAEHNTDAFRERYRHVDVLLIDDIQFIGGKERTQEEFFHTFNHLYESGSQIVLTSDRPPKALATLEERLRSRFEGGLQTDIAPPDIETRVAILEQKAMRLGLSVDKRILMAVAERFDSNIRELEGALNQVAWQSQLAKIPLTYETAVAIVNNLAPQRQPSSPPDVIRIVAHHYGTGADDIMGKSRRQPVARIRQVTMYLLREENGMSLEQIGNELGGRDHSTIAYGVNRIINELQRDEALRLELSKLREKIYTPLI